MRTAHLSSNVRQCRPGFSVVEVMVALIVVSVGLLAIAGSTALTLRTSLDATRRHAAAEQAASRVARLTAGGCDRAAGGRAASADGQMTEQWSVGARVNGFLVVSDTVRWTSARGARTFSLASAIAC
ncbi:hypothetical protein BH11GEM1_BH11GEM1_36100 [soil metagenome]